MRFLVILVAFLGVALVLQAGLIAFAAYIVIGVLLSSRYLAKEWIKNLEAERVCETTPREIGESIEIVNTIRNTGKIIIPWVLIEDLLPEQAIRQRRVGLKGSRLKVLLLRADGEKSFHYTLTFRMRGYYQIGPIAFETGDVFGLHRRHRILTAPVFVLVFPKVLSITAFNFASQRPIGEVRLANRLFEDPTRTAGVRAYQLGDPLQRIHWRATARTGQLHSRIYEATTLAGANILIDFHSAGYYPRGEPIRSELAITTAVSIASAVVSLNQQIGVSSNGRDATDRIRDEALGTTATQTEGFENRHAAREQFEQRDTNERLRPVIVETRRGFDQFPKIREMLARLELSDGRPFADFLYEISPRLARDATVIAILPHVPIETSVALGQLRRRGFAVSAVLIGMPELGSDARTVAAGRLMAEGIRDVRYVNTEDDVQTLGDPAAVPTPADYQYHADLA